MTMIICPCQRISNNSLEFVYKKQYYECCKPFHDHTKLPDTAELLMRSRYSAYVLNNIEYIIKTTLPAQQSYLDQKAISDWSQQTEWKGLQILHHIPRISKRHAQVEFKAFFDTPDGVQSQYELSTFVKLEKCKVLRWYFIDPTIQMTLTQKQPCICNSGNKFKHCCGQFL